MGAGSGAFAAIMSGRAAGKQANYAQEQQQREQAFDMATKILENQRQNQAANFDINYKTQILKQNEDRAAMQQEAAAAKNEAAEQTRRNKLASDYLKKTGDSVGAQNILDTGQFPDQTVYVPSPMEAARTKVYQSQVPVNEARVGNIQADTAYTQGPRTELTEAQTQNTTANAMYTSGPRTMLTERQAEAIPIDVETRRMRAETDNKLATARISDLQFDNELNRQKFYETVDYNKKKLALEQMKAMSGKTNAYGHERERAIQSMTMQLIKTTQTDPNTGIKKYVYANADGTVDLNAARAAATKFADALYPPSVQSINGTPTVGKAQPKIAGMEAGVYQTDVAGKGRQRVSGGRVQGGLTQNLTALKDFTDRMGYKPTSTNRPGDTGSRHAAGQAMDYGVNSSFKNDFASVQATANKAKSLGLEVYFEVRDEAEAKKFAQWIKALNIHVLINKTGSYTGPHLHIQDPYNTVQGGIPVPTARPTTQKSGKKGTTSNLPPGIS